MVYDIPSTAVPIKLASKPKGQCWRRGSFRSNL